MLRTCCQSQWMPRAWHSRLHLQQLPSPAPSVSRRSTGHHLQASLWLSRHVSGLHCEAPGTWLCCKHFCKKQGICAIHHLSTVLGLSGIISSGSMPLSHDKFSEEAMSFQKTILGSSSLFHHVKHSSLK